MIRMTGCDQQGVLTLFKFGFKLHLVGRILFKEGGLFGYGAAMLDLLLDLLLRYGRNWAPVQDLLVNGSSRRVGC